MQQRDRSFFVNSAGLVVVALCSLPFAGALAQGEGELGRYWGVRGSLDRVSWRGLDEVQPSGRGGPFESDGLGFHIEGLASVAEPKSLRLFAGMGLGTTGLGYDVIFESDPTLQSALELNYLSAHLSLRFGQPGARYVSVGIGAARYLVDSKYIDCGVITSCFGADTSAAATGAYVDLTGMVGRGVIVGVRVHFVDFDPVEAIDLGVRPLDGPIYSLSIGWEFGNWSRN